jgi:hypothetical protein
MRYVIPYPVQQGRCGICCNRNAGVNPGAPGRQRNVSAMIAAIKSSVASQLTVPINSSIMRQASPLVSGDA